LEQRRGLVLAATLTGQFATGFPVTILSVVLPIIARGYSVSPGLLTWAITGPMLVMAISTPVFGKIGDVFGHRRLFLISLAGSAVLAVITAAAPTAAALIAIRIASQAFGAAAQPSALALIMRVYPPAERGRASGWWSMVGAGAPVVGLVIGGPLAQLLGWRSLFLIQAVLTAVALAMAIPLLPKGQIIQRVKVDYLGAGLLMAGVLGFLFAVNRAPAVGVSPLIVAVFLAGLAAMALFVWRQLRAAHPLIQLSYFRNPGFGLPIAVLFCIFFGYMGGFVISPIYVESGLALSLAATSLVMMSRPIANSLLSPVWVRLPARWNRHGPVLGSLLSVAAMGTFAAGAAAHLVLAFIIGNVLSGLGAGIAQPALTATMINSVSAEDQGAAGGQQFMATQIGAVLGISVLGGIAAGHRVTGNAPAWVLAYLVGGGVAVLAVGLALLLSRHDRQAAAQAHADAEAASLAEAPVREFGHLVSMGGDAGERREHAPTGQPGVPACSSRPAREI
jgi:MFS family permease